MSIESLNQTINCWIKALENYTLSELGCKPSPASWSLGQVYFHLIDNTRYYIEQAKICLATDDHIGDKASPEAITMLANNEFPDTMIQGPDTNVNVPQPPSKRELVNSLMELKNGLGILSTVMSDSPYRGKTKHPGLGYFCANDWVQFADMHFRHHLRQKNRIDDFLRATEARSDAFLKL